KRRNISATNSNTSTISSASEIRKYKELLDDGIITEEEFNKKKQELLDL
ncbi:TPA: SHOCT domain-containing protein, partial [Enterococcus faecium]|nr:SHOCT domain-containing protein [Enterococcus faecium]HCI0305312.1 SHOCT domain-containing protein [Enterococcus faecium]HCI0322869.1 SHOCT domain-containing protein [Enterococcus faecium]HCI0340980.1 SHOCT domain-containing protein [Enterococcus faecium]HCI0368105.1 SHOCT domain-containing protein [Enterococcus faecium]